MKYIDHILPFKGIHPPILHWATKSSFICKMNWEMFHWIKECRGGYALQLAKN